MNFWPWTFMIMLVIIIVRFLIFKLELRWKTIFLITCINHMPCLSIVTADFRSIHSSITSSTSTNYFLWLITKNLLLFTEITNHMLLRINMVRWTKILWEISNFGHDKCSNQSSQIKALIPYQEVDFKPNSTLQNQLVKWGLHPLINYRKASSLVNVGSPIPLLMPGLLNSSVKLICKGSPIVAG